LLHAQLWQPVQADAPSYNLSKNKGGSVGTKECYREWW
jgi:hypothetical protein